MCFEKVIYTEAGWFVEPDRSSGTMKIVDNFRAGNRV